MSSAAKSLDDMKLHQAWSAMWRRCRNPKQNRWNRYGGRGITVCNEWRSFERFAHDMRPTWAPGLTLDRIDPDAGYSPENCRWADAITQRNNRRDSASLRLPAQEKE